MNGLTDVDGFKICFRECVWLGFPPLIIELIEWDKENYMIVKKFGIQNHNT